MKKPNLFITLLLFVVSVAKAQNVGISTTGAVPDASAMLDIVSTDRGLLVPRVALTALNLAAPVTGPVTSLLVYNTATAGATPNNVLPGYYYWDGVKWVAFAGSGGKDWALLGNSGTTPPSVGYGTTVNNNFLGTTDAQDLTFATNGLERMRIRTDDANNLRIGMGTAFTANYNSLATSSILHLNDWGTTANDFAAFNLSNLGITTGNKVGVINFAAAGATGASTVDRKTSSIESNLTALSGANVSGDIRFYTNNASSFTEKMRIMGSGNVGIANTAPTEKLDVTGNIRFSNALMPNNLAGTAGQALISQGAGVAPIWASSSSLGQGFSQVSATACTRYIGDNTSSYINGTSGVCSSGYTTGSWFNVAGLSITRTITSGNFVSVSVHIRWKTDNYSYWAPETIWFRILRDGTEIARSSMFTQDPDWIILEGDGNIFYYDAGATPGAHTYSVQTAISNNAAGSESYWVQDGYLTLIEIQ